MPIVLFEQPGRAATGLTTAGTEEEQITAAGGTVRDGEAFRVTYVSGGLTGATGINIDGYACTSFVPVSDTVVTAVAPADDLLHEETYEMVIY